MNNIFMVSIDDYYYYNSIVATTAYVVFARDKIAFVNICLKHYVWVKVIHFHLGIYLTTVDSVDICYAFSHYKRFYGQNIEIRN